jgi:3-hydroxybutyryl-CoA dehydrogenase
VEKGSLTAAAKDEVLARIETVDSLSAMAACDLVIEVIVENLDAKRALFAELEVIVSADCILATNTSSLAVTTIAAKLKTPERFAGMHFFNPVPVMKLVEVIDGVRTAPWVGDALMAIGRRMGREPVRLKDAPGFLVNQIGRGFTVESAHMASEGIAAFADIDRVMRDVAGFRMGPFELMELTGLDVTQPASVAIYEQSYHEARYRPVMLMNSRYQAGIFGKKTGKGFYDYDGDSKAIVAPEPAPPAERPHTVWVSPVEHDGHTALVALLDKLGVPHEAGGRPTPDALILVTPLGDDATTCAVEQDLDAKRTIAVDTLFPMDKRRTIMTTPITDLAYRDMAHGLLASDGKPVTVINDSPGFIAQRVVAMICNIGCALAQNGTAAPIDIDKGATLGLNYPHGPLAFGDLLGPAKIFKILTNMQRAYGDPRYRPSVWLSRRARLGVSLQEI